MRSQELIPFRRRSSLLCLSSPPGFPRREHRVDDPCELAGGVGLADRFAQLGRLPVVVLAQGAVRNAPAVIQNGRFQQLLHPPVSVLGKPRVADVPGGVPVGRRQAHKGDELALARKPLDGRDLADQRQAPVGPDPGID